MLTATTRDSHDDVVYDWMITMSDDQEHSGPIGRTDDPKKAKRRVEEAFNELPETVEVRGEVARGYLFDPKFRRVLFIAERGNDGAIAWVSPS